MSNFKLKKDLSFPYIMHSDRVTGKTEQVSMQDMSRNPKLWIQKGYASYFDGDVKVMNDLAAAYTKKLKLAAAAKIVPNVEKELVSANEARLEALKANQALVSDQATLQAKYDAAMKMLAEKDAESAAKTKKLEEVTATKVEAKKGDGLISTEEILKKNSKGKKS